MHEQGLPAFDFVQSVQILSFLRSLLLLLKILFIYILEREEGGRKRGTETSMCERYINWLPLTHPQSGTWPATQACALAGNRTGDPSVRRPVLSPPSHTSWGLRSLLYLISQDHISDLDTVQLELNKIKDKHKCSHVKIKKKHNSNEHSF